MTKFNLELTIEQYYVLRELFHTINYQREHIEQWVDEQIYRLNDIAQLVAAVEHAQKEEEC